MPRVLIVEDEPVVRMVMHRALSRAGHAVIEAGDCAEAREKAGYDVVVVDKNLPDGSGIDLAAELIRSMPSLPVIVLTGYASDAAVRAALDAGVFEFLRKPLNDINELAQAVQRAAAARMHGHTDRPIGHPDGAVLVIDDSARGTALVGALREAGLWVERSSDPEPAAKRVASERLRAAIVAGERTLAVRAILDAAGALSPRLPVYVIHDRGALDDVIVALRGGAAGYLVDVKPAELVTRLRGGR